MTFSNHAASRQPDETFSAQPPGRYDDPRVAESSAAYGLLREAQHAGDADSVQLRRVFSLPPPYVLTCCRSSLLPPVELAR